jgi:hypothetical protein
LSRIIQQNGDLENDFRVDLILKMAIGLFGIEISLGKLIMERAL